MKIINRKATFDYEVLETIEAGIVLSGAEARGIREKRVNLTNSYARVIGGELMLVNAQFGANEMGDTLSTRSRKLLVHKKELLRLSIKIARDKLTLVPLSVYNSNRFYKISLGLARAKKQFNKKQVIKEHDIKINAERELRGDKDSDSRRD